MKDKLKNLMQMMTPEENYKKLEKGRKFSDIYDICKYFYQFKSY